MKAQEAADLMVSKNELRDRYRRVMDRVGEAAEAAGRNASDVLVVAVTKMASPDQIRQLIELGHMDLGENRVQQLSQRVAMTEEFVARHRLLTSGKKTDVPARIRWHMVGHLQRNKVKGVLGLVKLIHSVDSLRLAEEIQATAGRAEKEVDVLLQVNVSGEKSKSGIAVPAAGHLAEQMQTMFNVRVRGLMAMGPLTEDEAEVRRAFERASEVYHEIRGMGICEQFNILSMGMSDDFEIAIEYGANMLRIGRALFGEGEGGDGGALSG